MHKRVLQSALLLAWVSELRQSLYGEGQVISFAGYPSRITLTNSESSFLLNLIYRLTPHTLIVEGSSFCVKESRLILSKQRTCINTVLGNGLHPSFGIFSFSQRASELLSASQESHILSFRFLPGLSAQLHSRTQFSVRHYGWQSGRPAEGAWASHDTGVRPGTPGDWIVSDSTCMLTYLSLPHDSPGVPRCHVLFSTASVQTHALV